MNDDIKQDLEYLKDNIARAKQYTEIQDTVPLSQRKFGRRFLTLLKKAVRKMIYWCIRPYWDQQIEFNRSVESALEDIYRIQSKISGATVENFEQKEESLLELEETKEKRIFQLVSSLNYGDAVGNDVMAIQRFLKEEGWKTGIFANSIHVKIPQGTAFSIEKLPEIREDDLILYHFASEDPIANKIKDFPCRVILRYHNVTPPHFFEGYDANAEKNTKKGLKQIADIKDDIDYGIVVSEFNKKDLLDMGYSCPIDVAPILIQFDDYAKKPSEEVISKYSDGKTNIVFVGRIAPNKKFEDVISSFAEYKLKYNKDARLFLVGNYSQEDKYYKFLVNHIKKLGVKDVVFPGHIPFDEILAYYKIADVFLCMSEHEGFCVPLVEAMYFNIPIIAYDSTAIPSTLAGSGVLIKEKDFDIIADKINEVVSNKELREEICLKESERLKQFDNEIIGKMICRYLAAF